MLLSYMCACILMCFLLDSMVGIGAMKFEAYTNPTQQKGRVLSSSITRAAHTRLSACEKTLAVQESSENFKSSHTDAARTSRHARISAAATSHIQELQHFLSTHPIRFMFVFISFDPFLRFYTCSFKYKMGTGKKG